MLSSFLPFFFSPLSAGSEQRANSINGAHASTLMSATPFGFSGDASCAVAQDSRERHVRSSIRGSAAQGQGRRVEVYCTGRNRNLPPRELAAILSRRNIHDSATSPLHR